MNNKHNCPYPIVDPRRLFINKGLSFRSKYPGLCPPGWGLGEHNMCYPVDQKVERLPVFYGSNGRPLPEYSTCERRNGYAKSPYNA